MEIHVGSRVLVLSGEGCFSAYTDAFKKHNFSNQFGNYPPKHYKEIVWRVFALHKHYIDTYDLICCIRSECENYELLIEKKSVELIKEKFSVWY